MSEESSKAEVEKRSKAAILDEYKFCAAQAGDLEYKIQYYTAQLKLLYGRMNQLDLEPALPEAPLVADKESSA